MSAEVGKTSAPERLSMTELERLRELIAINRAITSSLDYDEVLRRVVEKTADFAGAEACLLLLADPDGQAAVAASQGVDPASASSFRAPLDERIGTVLGAFLGFQSVYAFLGVPVINPQGVQGVLAIYRSGDRARDPAEEFLLAALADQASIALWHAACYRELRNEFRTESELAEARNRNTLALLDTLLHTAPIGIAFLDRELRYIRINECLAKMNGVPVEAHIGRHVSEIVPTLAESVREVTRRILETGEAVGNHEFSGETTAAPGVTRYWTENWYPVRDSAGEITGFGALIEDITERKEAEELLRQKERLLTESQSVAHIGSWMVDMKTGSVTWSDESARLYGFEPETHPKLAFEQFLALLHPDDRSAMQSWSNACVAGENPPELEFRACLADGSTRWLLGCGQLETGTEGEPLRMIGTVQDITERKRVEMALRESERLYRAIGESINYGVWVCAPDGRNTYASDSFLKLVGLTQEQCSNFGWAAVLHPDDAERTVTAWKECVRTGALWNIEHRFRGVDGQWHHVLARGVPVRDDEGRITCWAGINLDIDQLKSMEDALKEQARRKDDFLATLGHELRNPLAPIRTAVHLIRKAGQDPRIAEQACAIAERQVSHMVRLVDDLLDVTRITRGKIELQKEHIDLVETVRGVIADHRPLLDENHLNLEVDLPSEPIGMDADKARIIQIISNLLHNASKFTNQGGKIGITVRADGCGFACFSIRDTGTGIAPELLASIFEPFMQARETIGRSGGGLGLGLALVKGLAALHGGTVSAHSEGPGRGSEFRVRLPVRKIIERSMPYAAGPEGTAIARSRRVLIVEDSPDAAESMQLMLQLAGHRVEIALDGETGLAKADSFDPEVILCDIGLPGDLDGYDVARTLRKSTRQKTIYLAALTGFGQTEDKDKARQAGFDTHLTKPVDPTALEQLIARISHI